MPRKTDGIEFEIHPRPTKGEGRQAAALCASSKGTQEELQGAGGFLQQVSQPAHRRVADGV